MIDRRSLLKVAAAAPVAAMFPFVLPAIARPDDPEWLANEGAKRLHKLLSVRGPVEFTNIRSRRGVWNTSASYYACDDTSIFDIDQAAHHLAEKVFLVAGDVPCRFLCTNPYQSGVAVSRYRETCVTAFTFTDSRFNRLNSIIEANINIIPL